MGSGAFFGMTEGKLSGPPPLLAPVHERMEKRTQPCSLGLPLLYHVLGLGLGLLVLIPLYCSSFRDPTISRAIMSVYSVVTLDLGRFDRFDEPRDVNRGVNGKVRKRKRRRWRRNRIRVTRRILQNSLVFQNETYERRTLRRVTSPSLFVCTRSRARAPPFLDVATSHRYIYRCKWASSHEQTVSLTDRFVEPTSFHNLPLTRSTLVDRDACELFSFDTCAPLDKRRKDETASGTRRTARETGSDAMDWAGM